MRAAARFERYPDCKQLREKRDQIGALEAAMALSR